MTDAAAVEGGFGRAARPAVLGVAPVGREASARLGMMDVPGLTKDGLRGRDMWEVMEAVTEEEMEELTEVLMALLSVKRVSTSSITLLLPYMPGVIIHHNVTVSELLRKGFSSESGLVGHPVLQSQVITMHLC